MVFDEQSARRISNVVQAFERQNLNTQPRQKRWPTPSDAVEAYVYFEAPTADGIASGVTVACPVIGWSDGRDVEANETVMVENWTSNTVCETGNHRGHANRWQDHYRIYNEDRVC